MAAIVYLVTNRLNGKRYVGVTGNGLASRRRQHEQAPNNKRVTCRYFHAAMKKHGPSAFEWIVLASCETFEEALLEEVRLITEIKPEYNLTTGGQGTKGRVVSQEQRDNHSRVMKGRKRSAESVAKMIATNTGCKRTPEHRQRMSAGRTGMKFSAEHCRNIGLSKKGKKQPQAAIEARRQKALGRKNSPEHIEKVRVALKGKPRPREVVERILATRAKTFAETASKPWLAEGISKRYWFARRKQAREAAHGGV